MRVNILKTTKAQLLTDENFEAGNLSPDGLAQSRNIASTDYFKNGCHYSRRVELAGLLCC